MIGHRIEIAASTQLEFIEYVKSHGLRYELRGLTYSEKSSRAHKYRYIVNGLFEEEDYLMFKLAVPFVLLDDE